MLTARQVYMLFQELRLKHPSITSPQAAIAWVYLREQDKAFWFSFTKELNDIYIELSRFW
jgi:hypothetical protein